MNNVLAVPVHLDALYLKSDRLIVEAMADFSRLPYQDKRDVNSNIANISEEIVSQPFQNQNLYLKAGIHLHWALPDALTKGIQIQDDNQTKTAFPAVPNRWLVTRRRGNKIDQQWVVESDYIYPNKEGNQAGSIAYPFQRNSESQPFCYLGRKIPLEVWEDNLANSQYVPSLTAVGYGEPAFAAFYPNCYSVFGFHDDDYIDTIPQGLKYDIIGWYNQAQTNSWQDFLNELRNNLQQQGQKNPPNNQKFIEEQFKWTISPETEEELAASIPFICYGCLSFQPAENIDNPDRKASGKVTVGNTGTEALSAYLAQEIDSNNKSIIEEQLEALHLSPRLENRQLDITPKFKEMRHEKGFNAIGSGTLWTIRLENSNSNRADANDAHEQQQVTLPDNMAHLLNQVNVSQQQYDFALQEIESMRRQLFSDWYKYMLCSYPPQGSQDVYPDIDEVKYYIEVKGIASLNKKLITTGSLNFIWDKAGKLSQAIANNSATTSLAYLLTEKINNLAKAINTENQTLKASQSYILQPIAGPRYWQPKEPVVLVTGQKAKPSPKHGQDGRLRKDGLLECQILKDVNLPISKNNLRMIRQEIIKEPQQGAKSIAFNTWEQQPWHPFLLEWEVEVFPINEGSNHRNYNSNYENDFLTGNYSPKENEPDLFLQSGRGAIIKVANVYSGRSILTPQAGIKLKEQLEVYLNKQILPEYYQKNNIPKEQQTDDYLNNNDNCQALKKWYEQAYASDINTAEKKAKNPIYTAICAEEKLHQLGWDGMANSVNCLAQSLGGFNEALLMHKQTLQLPIADPLGFTNYQAFTEVVKAAVKNSIRSAPEPLNDFNPIRSGAMKILRLRLVDTFGQVQDLDVNNVFTTTQMTTPGSPYLISLPPRLVQPARLNFRWLSAMEGEQEMNSHPATTPICGWILPNNLDNSLAIYDNKGKALGSIYSVNQEAQWEAAPGDNLPLAFGDIQDTHLQRLVKHIISSNNDGNSNFLDNFITALDKGLENIDPENFAQHQSLALLMGRPIAVVRASLNLELQGLPRINQDWDVFWRDLRRNTRDTDDFEKVKIPVRLGEYQQLNDGLLGFWLEEKESLSQVFYMPQSNADGVNDPRIKFHDTANAWHIDLTVEDPPKMLTMLIDPRGKVHATCGILPVKAIDIPPDQYRDALAKIEITFLSTPIITPLKNLGDITDLDKKKICLPLPEEEGYEWSWLDKEKEEWLVVASENIAQPNLNAVFSGKLSIREGWLKLSRKEDPKNANNGNSPT